ncbi:MAG: hypothetical protein OES09_04500, partial [Gammaproteobacteria bacterium]|nr:hypothetical protein [Gammaproteobacteria bacterium]
MDKKHLSVVKRLIVGVFLASLFAQAHALGLGKLRVNSALDESLEAQIELTSVAEGELESLTAVLASRSDFRRAGVEFPEYLKDLIFEVSDQAGTPVIKIRSEQPAVEPFLHFLVAVEWSGGKLIREYTALLDPPVYAAETPTSVSSPRVVEAVPEAMPEGMAPAPETGVVEETVRFGEYGPIREGETLWGIASKLQVEAASVNIFQIMIALLRENPDAFFGSNMNRLNVGQILKIGDLEAIAEISPSEASVAYQAQLEEWQAYKQQVASEADVEKTPAAAAPMAAAGEAPGAGDAAAEEPAAEPDAAGAAGAAAADDKDVLRIVQATEASAEKRAEAGVPAPGVAEAEAEINRLNEQVTTLEEALASRELENQELKERVTMLEEQVKNATRLMEIESQELALAQQQAAERQEAAAKQAQAAAKAKAAEVPPAAKPKPKPKPKPRVMPVPEKAWWENLLDTASGYWTWLLGVLAVLVAGTGGLLFVRRRRSLAE